MRYSITKCEIYISIFSLFNIAILKTANCQDFSSNIYTDTIDHINYKSVWVNNIKEDSLSKQFYLLGKDSIKIGRLLLYGVNQHSIRKIPENIKYNNNIKYIEIGSNITSLGKGFSYLRNIKEILILNSKIKKISDCFDGFDSLKKCNITSQIKRIPKSFSKLHNLNSLTIYSPNLKTIPKFLENCQNLTYLNVSEAKYNKLDFRKFKKLKYLSIELKKDTKCSLSKYQPSIYQNISIFPQSLIELNLYLYDVESIFAGNFYLKSLEKIHIENCPKLLSFIDVTDELNDSMKTLIPSKGLYVAIINCCNLKNIDALKRLNISHLEIKGVKPEYFKNILNSLSHFNDIEEIIFTYSSFYKCNIPEEFVDFVRHQKFCRIIIEPDDEYGGTEKERINKETAEKLQENINKIKELVKLNNTEVKNKKYDYY